jgi:hypothetical protein
MYVKAYRSSAVPTTKMSTIVKLSLNINMLPTDMPISFEPKSANINSMIAMAVGSRILRLALRTYRLVHADIAAHSRQYSASNIQKYG